MSATRQRFRQVSPERIAKVLAAAKARGVSLAVKLSVDGSATLLTDGSGPSFLSDRDDAVAEINRALGIQ